jgi:ParB/RepB/Spo0J family partition protein
MSSEISRLTEEARSLVLDMETIQEHDPDNVPLLSERMQQLKDVRARLFDLHNQEADDDVAEDAIDDDSDLDNSDDSDDDPEPGDDYDEDDSEESEEDDPDADFDDESDEESDEEDDPDAEFEDESDEDSNDDSDIDSDEDSDDGVPKSTRAMTDSLQQSFNDMSLTKEQERKMEKITMEDLREEVKSSGVCSSLTIFDSTGLEVRPIQQGEMFIADIPVDLLHLPPAARLNMREVEDLELSFAEVGQLQPIHVIPFESANGFIIIDGKRRFAAARNLSMRSLRAVVDTTRNKTWIRYLELIINSTRKPYNFKELMTAGNFVNSKQPHLSTEVVDRLLGLPSGSFLEGKMLLIEPVDNDILIKLSQGKLSINQAYKALVKKRDKEEKELEKLAAEVGPDLGDLRPVDYSDVDRTPLLQTTGDGRRPLERWLTEAIERRDGRACQCCGLGHGEETFISVIYEKHHMIPVSKKGPDSEDNLILLCKNCHSIVHAIVDAKFMPQQGKEDEFHNHIVLAKIITDGPAGYTPYERYHKEYVNFWLQ